MRVPLAVTLLLIVFMVNPLLLPVKVNSSHLIKMQSIKVND